MTHKLLTAVCALALVLSFSFSATAAVQNVKVGGDIEIKGIYQTGYDILDEITIAGATVYDNDPIVHDYLMQTVRLYVDASLTDNVEAYVRVINQRDWDMNYAPAGTVADDVNIDLAYLTLSEMYGYPCSLTIGRQELLYGEGFLVGDGVRVIDASQTYQYDPRKAFDAIKAVWDYEPHQVDLFIAKVTEGANTAAVFGAAPVNSDNDLYGINWNYDGGMYGLWDLGLFYNRSNVVVASDGENQTWALSLRGEGTVPQIDVGTLALKGELVKEWGIVEPAMQPMVAATTDNERLDAWGGYAEAEYTFDNVYAPYLGLGYIYMSGDNDDSDPIEQFNPLFEDETYGEIFEVVYGLWFGGTTMSNVSIWKFSAGVNPTENTALDFTYYSLTANQSMFSPFAPFDLDDQDLFLGTEYDLNFTYNYSEDVTFGLMYNLFNPGSFFEAGADEATVATDVNLNSAAQLMGSVKVSF